MTQSLEIAQLGNPILRQLARPIDNVHDEPIQKLIQDLKAKVLAANGVGIAAPQLSKSCRLFILASRPNPRYPNAPMMEPTAMINPQIVAHSDQVEYTNQQGKPQRQQLTDFVARIVQHEYDHLNGVVFLDRVESTHDLITEQEYQRQIGEQT